MIQHLQLEHLTRRHFLSKCSVGLGGMWLASQGLSWGASSAIKKDPTQPLLPDLSHFAPKAKRVIFELFHYYLNHIDLLTGEYAKYLETDGKERAVADYIAGMTDNYAVSEYVRIFVPKSWMDLTT